jgi:hypothetical protein
MNGGINRTSTCSVRSAMACIRFRKPDAHFEDNIARSGKTCLAYHHASLPSGMNSFEFGGNDFVNQRYLCSANNVSPTLQNMRLAFDVR